MRTDGTLGSGEALHVEKEKSREPQGCAILYIPTKHESKKGPMTCPHPECDRGEA